MRKWMSTSEKMRIMFTHSSMANLLGDTVIDGWVIGIDEVVLHKLLDEGGFSWVTCW
jgi:hypothetical protein